MGRSGRIRSRFSGLKAALAGCPGSVAPSLPAIGHARVVVTSVPAQRGEQAVLEVAARGIGELGLLGARVERIVRARGEGPLVDGVIRRKIQRPAMVEVLVECVAAVAVDGVVTVTLHVRMPRPASMQVIQAEIELGPWIR